MGYVRNIRRALNDLGRAIAGKERPFVQHVSHDLRVLFPEHMREDSRDGYLDLDAVPIGLFELQRVGLFLLTQLDSALTSKDRLDEVLTNFERLSDQNQALDQLLAHAYRDLDMKDQYQKRLRLDIQDLEGQIEQHEETIAQMATDSNIASLDLATSQALYAQSLALIARYQEKFGDLPDVESAQ